MSGGFHAFCQSTPTPSVKQDAKNSSCSNIVALAGNVKVDCSSLTPTQKKTIESIPLLLQKILSEQVDPDALMTAVTHIESEVNTTGVLEPGSQGNQNGASSILKVVVGSNLVNVYGDKCTILNIGGEDMLWIERASTGILVSAKVFSPDRRIVATVEKNNVTVNPNNTFKRKIGKHTLLVVDELNQEVLNVDFVNPHLMMIDGLFYSPAYGRIDLTRGMIFDGRRTMGWSQSRFGCPNGYTVFTFGVPGTAILSSPGVPPPLPPSPPPSPPSPK